MDMMVWFLTSALVFILGIVIGSYLAEERLKGVK